MITFAPLLLTLLFSSRLEDWFLRQMKKIEKLCPDGAPPGLVEKALPLLDEMEERAQGNPHARVWPLWARWQRARCRFMLGQLAQAQKTMESAIRDTNQAVKDEDKDRKQFLRLLLWNMHRDLGEFYLRDWKYEQAKAHIDQAVELVSDLAKVKDLIAEDEVLRTKLLKVTYLQGLGQNVAAREEVKPIRRDIQQRRKRALEANADDLDAWTLLLVRCELILAALDERASDTATAIERRRASLKLLSGYDKGEPLRLRMFCHLQLVLNYQKLVRFRDAREELRKAEAILDRVGNLRDRGDLNNHWAALLLAEALLAFEETRNRQDVLKRLDDAQKTARAALSYYGKAEDRSSHFTADTLNSLARIHYLRGQLYEAQGDNDAALREYTSARERCEQQIRMLKSIGGSSLQDTMLMTRQFRAVLSLKVGERDEARKDAVETFRLWAKNHPPRHVDNGLFLQLLLAIEDDAGNTVEAARHADALRKLAAESVAPYVAGLTATEQVQFFRHWDDLGLHSSLRLGARRGASQSVKDQSVEWLINGKAKIAEVTAEVNKTLRRRGEAGYQEFQRCVRRQAALLYGAGDADPKTLERFFFEQEQMKRGLAEKRGTPPPGPWYELDQLRGRLSADEVYIDIFGLRSDESARRVYHAWVVTARDPVRVVELGDAETIDKLVTTFLTHQEGGNRPGRPLYEDGSQEAERKLRRDCLKPISAMIFKNLWPLAGGKKRWIVSPDGPLWGLPWAALLLPKSDKYAIEEIAFRYVISGRDLARPSAPKVQTDRPWVLADPDLDRAPGPGEWRRRDGEDPFLTLARLPAAKDEGQQVAACLKTSLGVESRMQKESATKEALLGLKSPRLLYLSTHGFFNLPSSLREGDPLLRCGIAFAGLNYVPRGEGGDLPGLMTGAEVLAVDLSGTELVVLSACESGKGVTQYGQSPADLRHAFHLAGAQAVVSSLWPVEDLASHDLMIAFVRALSRQGMADKAVALQKAQVQMIKQLRESSDRHAHPFFWAAFTLSGS